MKKYALVFCFVCAPFSGVWANIDAICNNVANVQISVTDSVRACFDRNGCVDEGSTVSGCDQTIAQQCCEAEMNDQWEDNCDTPPPSDWGECEGEYSEWDRVAHTRVYTGVQCRAVVSAAGCNVDVRESECEPCDFVEEDLTSPTCESVAVWDVRPLESVVLSCEDDLSGCDESFYENGSADAALVEVNPATACDMAGNCVDCPISNPDETPPTCVATFDQPGRWHRDENFEENGGDLYCWIESCEDIDGDGDGNEVASGCLPLGTNGDTVKTYDDPDGLITQVQVEQDPIEPIHLDTCQILACDNAGNCSTCESPEIAYDGTNVCRAADQNCDSCAEDDLDCRCISGERDQCTDAGPVNCYADPFHERCPAFDNEACLSNNFIPGCPTFNPCYPESNRTHPRIDTVSCPADAIRFCSRNPYHYGCNEACKFDLIECDPDVPSGEVEI